MTEFLTMTAEAPIGTSMRTIAYPILPTVTEDEIAKAKRRDFLMTYNMLAAALRLTNWTPSLKAIHKTWCDEGHDPMPSIGGAGGFRASLLGEVAR